MQFNMFCLIKHFNSKAKSKATHHYFAKNIITWKMYFINQQVENSYWEAGKYCDLSQNQSKVSIRKRENLEHLLFS